MQSSSIQGQHSLQHARSNNRLKAQGIDVDAIDARYQAINERQRHQLPRSFALAMTAAYEHLTTITSHAVTEHSEYFADADPRIFALYAWHCSEELEHKAVSFDVMQKVARVGYFARVLALVLGTQIFNGRFMLLLNQLFRADGFSVWQRLALWRGGLRWMYGRNGFFRLQVGHYFAYFRPGFHPSQRGATQVYARWAETLRRTGDPLAASEAMRTP